MGEGLALQLNSAACEATTPLPDKGILIGELDVLLARETVPPTFPVSDGWKLTDRVTYCPGGKVTPAPIPLAEKLGPETEFCCKVTGLSPALEKVTSKDLVLPTATSPKSALELPIIKPGSAGAGVEIAPLPPPPPPQPAAARTPARRAIYSLSIRLIILNYQTASVAHGSARRFFLLKNDLREFRKCQSPSGYKLRNQTMDRRTGLGFTECPKSLS